MCWVFGRLQRMPRGCSSVGETREFTLKYLPRCLPEEQNVMIKSRRENKVASACCVVKSSSPMRPRLHHFACASFVDKFIFVHCFTLINKRSDSLKVRTRMLGAILSFPFFFFLIQVYVCIVHMHVYPHCMGRVYVWVSAQATMRTCIWKQKVTWGSPPLLSSLFIETRSLSWTQSSSIWLVSTAS